MSGPLLLHVFEALPHAVSVIDAEGRLAYANPAFFRDAGVEPEVFPPDATLRDMVRLLAYRGLYGPGDPEAQTAAVLAMDRSRPFCRRIRAANGGDVFELASVPLPGGGFLNTAHRVSAYARAQEAAEARARTVEMVLGHLSGGVVHYEADGRITLLNTAFEMLIGCPPGSLRPGMTHRDVLALQVARGEFLNADAAVEVAERIERDRRVRSVRQRERPNGTVLQFESHPMPDGGFMVEVNDITALKRAEDEARRRAALLDGVLEALPHGVVVFGPDRRAVMSNSAYLRLLGESAARSGERLDDLIARRRVSGEYDEATAAAVLLRFSATAEGAAARAAGMRRVRADGTVMDNRMERLPDGRMISVFTDVTALHRAEEEARARAELLDAVLDALPDGVCVYGPDRRARITNPAYHRLLGEFATRLGESLEEVSDRRAATDEHSREVADKLLRRHDAPPETARQAIRLVMADGGTIVTRAGRLPDGGYIAVVTDVTALHRAEQALQQRAGMQEAMLSNIRQGIVLYSPDRRVLASNAKAAELIGMPADGLRPGLTLDAVLEEQVARGELAPALAKELREADRSRALRSNRVRPDGRVIEIASDPTPDGGFVITITDVTEERRIRTELEEARAAAEAGSAAKSRFLATMSHELRTPLNAVIGFSEAIALERDRNRIEEYAAAVNEAGRHLLLLIDDILDVARSQTGTLPIVDEPVALTPLLVTAARDIGPAAMAAGLTLDLALPSELPALRGDARRLSQVIGKLLSNAVKFTPAGGRVALSAAEEGEGLCIRVADTGIGIPPEDRERSFEPFTQLDGSLSRRFQGSGLGLYLARSLATALGATLTLEDPAGPGLVAVLRFPAERLVTSTAQPA